MKGAVRKTCFALTTTMLMAFSSSSFAGCSWWNWWKCYTETQHPIVLAHGFMGFESILGLVDYWPGIVDRLEDGGATVYIAQVSAMNSSEARGEQLIEQIENFLAINGGSKVNIIGHSQGGLDARYVASVRPDLVASITTLGSPHDDGVAGAFGADAPDENIMAILQVLAELIQALSGNPSETNAEAAAAMFSGEGIAQFNANYPIGLPASDCGQGPASVNVDGHNIRVYSWGGTGIITTGVDITDALMAITGVLVGGQNDGLVPRCDTHLGKVLRDNYNHNHLDLTNMMFGLVPLFESDPKSIFRAHANRLKNAGL